MISQAAYLRHDEIPVHHCLDGWESYDWRCMGIE